MNTKKFLLATVAGFVGNFVAYFILEEIALKSYMQEHFYKASGAADPATLSPALPMIAVLCMVLIMSYLYPKGYENGKPVIEGLKFGILLGLFAAIPFGIFFNLLFSIGSGPTLTLILVFTAEVTVSSLAIALVYGRIQAEE